MLRSIIEVGVVGSVTESNGLQEGLQGDRNISVLKSLLKFATVLSGIIVVLGVAIVILLLCASTATCQVGEFLLVKVAIFLMVLAVAIAMIPVMRVRKVKQLDGASIEEGYQRLLITSGIILLLGFAVLALLAISSKELSQDCFSLAVAYFLAIHVAAIAACSTFATWLYKHFAMPRSHEGLDPEEKQVVERLEIVAIWSAFVIGGCFFLFVLTQDRARFPRANCIMPVIFWPNFIFIFTLLMSAIILVEGNRQRAKQRRILPEKDGPSPAEFAGLNRACAYLMENRQPIATWSMMLNLVGLLVMAHSSPLPANFLSRA